jgi:cytochrome c-type biogenesis protein CcmE
MLFRVTDLANTIAVSYTGILPDLFREGQGVVVEGRIRDGVLIADQVLAKHDEKYMPPEVAESLKKSGQWQDMQESMRAAGQLPPKATP